MKNILYLLLILVMFPIATKLYAKNPCLDISHKTDAPTLEQCITHSDNTNNFGWLDKNTIRFITSEIESGNKLYINFGFSLLAELGVYSEEYYLISVSHSRLFDKDVVKYVDIYSTRRANNLEASQSFASIDMYAIKGAEDVFDVYDDKINLLNSSSFGQNQNIVDDMIKYLEFSKQDFRSLDYANHFGSGSPALGRSLLNTTGSTFVSFQVNSVLENLYRYSAANLTDKRTFTAWCEGSSGDGKNEELNIYLNMPHSCFSLVGKHQSTCVIESLELTIFNGYQKTEKSFSTNARVKNIRIHGNLGSSVQINSEFTLRDEAGSQQITIPLNVEKSTLIPGQNKLTLTVLDVYKGDKYTDMCITEIGDSIKAR